FVSASRIGRVFDVLVSIPACSKAVDEFMPQKTWWKRLAYDVAARSSLIDWALHRKYFAGWARRAIADHHLRTWQLQEGLAKFGLAAKLRRFEHHDTHAANAFYGSG